MSTRKKVIAGVLLLAAALLFGLFLFFDTIIGGQWGEKQDAVERAYKETLLAKAERVEPFVGSQPYTIIYGEDKLGSKMIVWVSESELHAAYQNEGISKEAVIEKVTATHPDNKIIRVTPGKLEDTYVWEVYYQREQEGKTYSYYDYFRFTDGLLMDTFNLGVS